VSIFDEEELFASQGLNFEVGALYRPNNEQYRLGASVEGPVNTSALDDDEPSIIREGFFLPRGAYKPWEIRLGGAYQFGNRPLNPVWDNVDEVVAREVGDIWDEMSSDEQDLYRKETWRRLRREFRAMPRRYILTTASLHIIGPARDAVSVEGFLTQTVQHSGNGVNLSPRWGLETDVVPSWITMRYGNYVEPSRVAQMNPRFHYTFGLDVKLGWWDVLGVWSEDYLWRLGLSMDVARDYYVGSVSIGGWY
jgi:hypothetical protein